MALPSLHIFQGNFCTGALEDYSTKCSQFIGVCFLVCATVIGSFAVYEMASRRDDVNLKFGLQCALLVSITHCSTTQFHVTCSTHLL